LKTEKASPGYAVLVEKGLHFLEKVGHFRKKPYYFQLVKFSRLKKKSGISGKVGQLWKVPFSKNIRGILHMF
jgi:hypothetical protein